MLSVPPWPGHAYWHSWAQSSYSFRSTERTDVTRLVSFPSSPEILAERARAVIQKAGYPDPPLDSTQGFSYHGEYIDYLSAQDPSPTMYAPLSTDEQGAVRFWYRQSPHYLVPHRVTPGQFFPRDFDPPASVPGMVQVQLDLEGRLRRFSSLILIPQKQSVRNHA